MSSQIFLGGRWATWRVGSVKLLGCRFLHGHVVRKKLNKLSPLRHKYLDDIRTPSYISEPPDYQTGSQSGVKTAHRREKEQFIQELNDSLGAISGLFGKVEKNRLLGKNDPEASGLLDQIDQEEDLPPSKSAADVEEWGPESKVGLERIGLSQSMAEVSEACRMYKILKPDAPPFYFEDMRMGLQAGLNRSLVGTLAHPNRKKLDELSAAAGVSFDNLQFNLPVVNPKSFVLALEAVCMSIADDLEDLCVTLDLHPIPDRHAYTRLQDLVALLCSSFQLRMDPEAAEEWAEECWPKLQKILPHPLNKLPNKMVGRWLRGHLHRVIANKAIAKEREDGGVKLHAATEDLWYNFGEDFMYDDFPFTDQIVDDRNLEFPLHEAGAYLKSFNNLFQFASKERIGPLCDQFQRMIYDLEKIGLRNWLRMDVGELEKYLPEGEIPEIDSTDDDVRTAKLMLKAAARGKGNLLEFEAMDPHVLLNEFPALPVEEELKNLPENPYLSDLQIEELFDLRGAQQHLSMPHPLSPAVSDFIARNEMSPTEKLLEHEREFFRSGGPAQYERGDTFVSWRWKKPDNTIYDANTGVFVKEQEGLDPLVNLSMLRQTQLAIQHMTARTSAGAVPYFRSVVAVGDGRGYFGLAWGFGRKVADAMSNAARKAVQSTRFIDFDAGGVLSFPVRGREYSHHVKMRSRPMGKGIQVNGARSLGGGAD